MIWGVVSYWLMFSAMMLSVSTYSWMMVWVSMEMMLIILVPWVAGTPSANESVTKYFLIYSLVLYTSVIILNSYKLKSVYLVSSALPFSSCLCVGVSLASLAGVPPLLGFVMKWIALIEIMSMSAWLGVGLLSCAAMTIYMYAQVLVYMFAQPLMVGPQPHHSTLAPTLIVLNLMSWPVLLFSL